MIKQKYLYPDMGHLLQQDFNNEMREKVVRGLEFFMECGLTMVLIGGAAVKIYTHGKRILSPDIDFFCPEEERLVHYLVEKRIPTIDLLDANGWRIGVSVEAWVIDILFFKAIGNKELKSWPYFDRIRLWGFQVYLIPLDLLQWYKYELGRSKDLEDWLSLSHDLSRVYAQLQKRFY